VARAYAPHRPGHLSRDDYSFLAEAGPEEGEKLRAFSDELRHHQDVAAATGQSPLVPPTCYPDGSSGVAELDEHIRHVRSQTRELERRHETKQHAAAVEASRKQLAQAIGINHGSPDTVVPPPGRSPRLAAEGTPGWPVEAGDAAQHAGQVRWAH
jgi:hypothetical protein